MASNKNTTIMIGKCENGFIAQLILMHQKDHWCQQDAIVNDPTHKEILPPDAPVATVG
jgi:hypothetical protein